jgi:cytochrome c oxidase cbb3-type subunit 4
MDFTIYHVILIVVFVAIVIWAYGRRRKARFDKDARIPFDDPKERRAPAGTRPHSAATFRLLPRRVSQRDSRSR